VAHSWPKRVDRKFNPAPFAAFGTASRAQD
jgi:hypothetical protein